MNSFFFENLRVSVVFYSFVLVFRWLSLSGGDDFLGAKLMFWVGGILGFCVIDSKKSDFLS
jgi:hypothetical protein